MERLQIHAQRDCDGIAGVDPVELLAGETGGAHHGVVVRGGACVGHIGELPRGPARKHLAHKAIQALMGDHQRGDTVVAAPPAQRSQREPVRHLQRVGPQRCQEGLDGSRHHRTVAAGEGNQPGGQGDSDHAGVELDVSGPPSGDDQEDLVTARAVFGAQPVDRGAKAAGARAVEIGDLYNAHNARTRGARVRTSMPNRHAPEHCMNFACGCRYPLAGGPNQRRNAARSSW